MRKVLKTYRLFALILTILGIVTLHGTAMASPLALTLSGTAAGFSLSTFADSFPVDPGSGCCGPFGIGFPQSGGVLVSDINGDVYHFPTDTDGQAATGLVTQSYGFNNAFDMATSGGKIYMAGRNGGMVSQLNDDGTFNHTVVSGLGLPGLLPDALALVTHPITGHLFVSEGSSGIEEVDPITGTVSPFVIPSGFVDGLSISSDGSTLYAAVFGSNILGFDTTTKAQVFDSGPISGGVDGTALGAGTLAGQLFVNNNDGTVVQVDVVTKMQTIIASGGTRGDFVKVDPSNCSLLLTQTDDIVRLTAPAGACFVTAAVPEPSTFLLLTSGLVGMGLVAWRKRYKPA